MNLIITVSVAFVGALIAKKMRIPASYMTGSLIAVALYSVFTAKADMPMVIKPFIQIITGSYIGSGIRKSDIMGMKKIAKPIVISLLSMLIVMLFSSLILSKLFSFEMPTALLSAVPGGISDITLLSYEFGADVSIVALMQTTRLFVVLAFFPILIGKICGERSINKESYSSNTAKKKSFKNLLATLSIGLISGLFGYYMKVPAGALSFSLVATALYGVKMDCAYIPISMRRAVQLLSGALIGSGITMASIRNIPSLFIPILCIVTIYFGSNYIVSRVISSKTDIDRPTAMFATAPAGASDMVLIAMEMNLGINNTTVVLMQIARLVMVVTLIPAIIKWILIYL